MTQQIERSSFLGQRLDALREVCFASFAVVNAPNKTNDKRIDRAVRKCLKLLLDRKPTATEVGFVSGANLQIELIEERNANGCL